MADQATGQQKKPTTNLAVFVAFVLVAATLDLSLNWLAASREHAEQEAFVNHELSAIRARLEGHLNTNLFLVYGMGASISARPEFSSRQFDALARVLLNKSDFLKNIAAAPDFVVRYIYPLAGNEAVLGLDYRTVPDQWKRALDAKLTGRMAVAGPLNLVQGGSGLIARIPVFLDETGEFWGLVSSVIDFDRLITLAGLSQKTSSLNLAIRGKDSKGSQGEMIFGNPDLFNAEARAVTMPVSLPSGSWQMAAVPGAGWRKTSSYAWLIHLVVLATAIFGCGVTLQQIRIRRETIASEKRLKAMSEASLDAIIMIDTNDRVEYWNKAAEAMFGYSEADMIGRKFHDRVVLPDDMDAIRRGMEAFAKTGTGRVMNNTIEMQAVRKSGEVFPVERSVASFQIGSQWYAVGSLRDITVRKQDEKRLVELATTDSLTGLANRRYFMEKAESQHRQSARYHKEFSLMMFDLDHFKAINDTYGHDAGDKVLAAVAATVRSVLRETDIIGRIGGEEFAVAMPETDLITATSVAERLRRKLEETYVETDGHTIRFTVSIGVVDRGTQSSTLSKMLKQADTALYQAKQDGRNQVKAVASDQ